MKLEILVGMIASGKSTYARKRADEGALVISHDDLTEMLHARYRYEPGLRDCYVEMLKALARVALGHGRDLVVDRTHLTREARRVWIEFAGAFGVPIVAVVFPIESPVVHARRRFSADPRGRPCEEWLEVAIYHHGQATADPIDESEGFDEIVHHRREADASSYPCA
jgi:predicted kinase